MRTLLLRNLVQSIHIKKLVQFTAKKCYLNPRSIHTTSLINSEMWYTESHEWIKVEDQTGTIGITDFAQEKLGEIVFCELPDVGTTFEKGESFAVIESVKAAEDLFIPVSGEIVEINEILSDESQTINTSPFDKGWLVKVNLGDGFDSSELLNADEYNALKDSEE